MRTRFTLSATACAAGLCLWMLAVAPVAHAGLFEDDDARKAILELRTKQSQSEEALRKEIAAAVRSLQEQAQQIQQLQRGLLDLNNQNEQLRAENAKLRGQDEQILRDLADMQRRQKDLVQNLEDRLRRLEPQKVNVDGVEFTADTDEKRGYDNAMAILRTGDFDKAGASLTAFLNRYPASGYAPSARYWLGNALYGTRDYKEAVSVFRTFLTASPNHPRAAEAMLASANCYAEMKDNKTARKMLEDLIKQFPKSEAAVAAKERLAALK